MKRDLNKALGKVLKGLREEKGMSQQELGDYSEVDRSFISRLERGIATPSVSLLFRVCSILQVKPSYVLERVESLLK